MTDVAAFTYCISISTFIAVHYCMNGDAGEMVWVSTKDQGQTSLFKYLTRRAIIYLLYTHTD